MGGEAASAWILRAATDAPFHTSPKSQARDVPYKPKAQAREPLAYLAGASGSYHFQPASLPSARPLPVPTTADPHRGGDWRKGQRRRCGPFPRKKGHQPHACRRRSGIPAMRRRKLKTPALGMPNSAHRICCQAEHSWDRELPPMTAWGGRTVLHCCTRWAMQYGRRGSTRASRGLPPFWSGANVSG